MTRSNKKINTKITEAQQFVRERGYLTTLVANQKTGNLEYLIFWKEGERVYILEAQGGHLNGGCFFSHPVDGIEDGYFYFADGINDAWLEELAAMSDRRDDKERHCNQGLELVYVPQLTTTYEDLVPILSTWALNLGCTVIK